jgi:hypothetical protein
MSQWRALNAVMELRRKAADVVLAADMAIYGQEGTAEALRRLPDLVRSLQFRASRALTALEGEGEGTP